MDANQKFKILENNLKNINVMAKNVYDMEHGGDFDSSMQGVFIDKFMTAYVAISGVDFCNMFDMIMEKQTKNHETYGDLDESVTKLTIIGQIGRDIKDYTYSATGMYLRDNFSSNNFIIVRVVEQHKEIERFIHIEYHVRKLSKELLSKELKEKTVDFKKYVQYGDRRDNGYTVTFQKPKYERPLIVKDECGMINIYQRYEEALRAIRAVHYSIIHEPKN